MATIKCATPSCISQAMGGEDYCFGCIAEVERAAWPVIVLAMYHHRKHNKYGKKTYCECDRLIVDWEYVALPPVEQILLITTVRTHGRPATLRKYRRTHCELAYCMPWGDVNRLTLKLTSAGRTAQARGYIKSFKLKLYR